MYTQDTLLDGVVVEVDKQSDKLLLNKIRKPLKTTVSRGVAEIYDEVSRVFTSVRALIPHIDNYELVTTKERLQAYFAVIKRNGVVAIDTETDGLNPINDRIAGVSLYTRGENPVYIPINHDYYDNNVSVALMTDFFGALVRNDIKIIMHNAAFDIRVILNAFGVRVACWHDTQIAAKVLNENEPKNNLKFLWAKYVVKVGQQFSYGELFEGIKFTTFDVTKVYVYAAVDALMTYDLYDFQREFLDPENPNCIQQDLVETAYLFRNIEMPVVMVAVDMEERGVSIDKAKAKALELDYSKRARALERVVNEELVKLLPKIVEKLPSSVLNKLSNPINISSTAQLKIILYDGLDLVIPKGKIKSKKEKPVDKEALAYFASAYPEYNGFLVNLLKYRNLIKLISTYLIALPNAVNEKTNRLHTRWLTIGADTGRFSSKEPNLQNIPSKNKDIRPIFVPKDGYVFIGSDYSQQEPRILAEISQDPVLIDNYNSGRDIYATLASMAYRLPYEQCTKDTPDGKIRRDHGKTLLLALSYGMQAQSLSNSLGISLAEGQSLFETFRQNLHVAFEYGDSVKRFCKVNGYIKTLWGRKRRFPDYLLPEFSIDGEITSQAKRDIISRIRRTRYNQRWDLIQQLQKDMGIIIHDNTRLIRDCETQILNSRVQGSAAEMTKLALIMCNYDKELVAMDARPVLAIHDEIILEAPVEHAERARIRLEEIMIEAARERVKSVSFKAEGEVMTFWHKD